MTTPSPYEPQGALQLGAEGTEQKLFRIGIQGSPKAGKTWAALTFPNPIVLDFDNNLRGFNDVYKDKKILSLPFWDAKFVDSIHPRSQRALHIPNQRDALKKWLQLHGPKITPVNTLILDSWTRMQDAFDMLQEQEPVMTKFGKPDDFAFWRLKQEYSRDILQLLSSINANIVVIFHETIERNDEGRPTGKLKPLMDGKFSDKLAGYFTDWFRQTVVEAEGTKEKQWLWQVVSDNIANCGTSLRKLDLKNTGKFIKADYKSLIS